MQDSEMLRYLIALPLLQEVGNKRSKEFYDFFGDAKSVFQASAQDLETIPNIGRQTISAILSSREQALRRADEELRFIDKHKIQPLFLEDEAYPARLRECQDAPLLLFAKGNVDANRTHMLSVVGTRMPSDRGKERCRKIILELAERVKDLVIVSGLAYGIDVTAHKAALEAKIPTIIIPGHGLDRIYPAVHRQVAIDSLERGGILTEYMSGTSPDRQNFVARNRIIAGLSDATLVVESKEKGGSLITADMAWGYDRDVLTFPGRPEDPCSKGCNQLIKQQKAALIEDANDLLATLRWEESQVTKSPQQTELFTQLSDEELQIVELLSQYEDGLQVNRLAMEVKVAFSKLTSMLFNLELSGIVKSLPGGIYRLRTP